MHPVPLTVHLTDTAPARRIALQLRDLGFGAVPIHGQMSQPKRIGALHKFKSGDRSILVATGKPFFRSPVQSDSSAGSIMSGVWGLEPRLHD